MFSGEIDDENFYFIGKWALKSFLCSQYAIFEYCGVPYTRCTNKEEAFAVWENMSQTPETMYAYQSRLKYMLDEEAKYVDTLAKGKKEGVEIGKEEGKAVEKLETIRNGLTNGIELETLALLTGYSLEELKKVIEQL